MVEWLVCFPIAWSLIAFSVPSNRWRPWLLPVGGAVHLWMTTTALQGPGQDGFYGWLSLDPLGKIFLGLVSLLFLLCACYAPGYLAQRCERNNRVLCTCLMLSLGMMSLIVLSHHLGLMWVAMETTTLVSAPGLYFNHNPRSLEATWKYLLICSVGIALALLGSCFFCF
jgi:hydrogenase-4 component F